MWMLPLQPRHSVLLGSRAAAPCRHAAAAHQLGGSAAGVPSPAGCRRLASFRHLSLQYLTAAQVASSDHLARRFIGRWHCWHICRLHARSPHGVAQRLCHAHRKSLACQSDCLLCMPLSRPSLDGYHEVLRRRQLARMQAIVHVRTLNSQRCPLFVPIQMPSVSLGASDPFELPRLACSGIAACLRPRLSTDTLPILRIDVGPWVKTAACARSQHGMCHGWQRQPSGSISHAKHVHVPAALASCRMKLSCSQMLGQSCSHGFHRVKFRLELSIM